MGQNKNQKNMLSIVSMGVLLLFIFQWWFVVVVSVDVECVLFFFILGRVKKQTFGDTSRVKKLLEESGVNCPLNPPGSALLYIYPFAEKTKT